MSGTVQEFLSNDQKNMIFENMSDGIITINAEGNVTYLNSACKEILEINEQEILNQSFSDTFLTDKKNKEFNHLFELCFHRNLSLPRKIIKYRKGNELKHFNIEVSLINPKENFLSKEDFQGMVVLIEDVTDTWRRKTHARDCALIFAGIIVCTSVYLSIWSLLNFTLHISLRTDDYARMIEGITLLLFMEIIFFTSFSLKDVGLIPKRSRMLKNIKQTLLVAVISCGVLAIIKEILLLTGFPVKQYFIGGSPRGAYVYLFSAFLQEFLARGVIQTSVKHLMHIRFQTISSIILTSLLFMLMHLPFGFIFMMGAFLLSIALGIIYEQQKSIWGCAFLHWSVGYLAMCLFF